MGKCKKLNVGQDQQQYVELAAQISNNDINFLALLEAENGLWTPNRQSEYIDSNGKREDSWGFCQINRQAHPQIVNDSRFFSPQWQIEQCWNLYQSGTTFYGKKNIYKTIKNFKCSQL